MRHVPPSSDPALTAAADAQRGSARVNHQSRACGARYGNCGIGCSGRTRRHNR
jgi:hypothetical protein